MASGRAKGGGIWDPGVLVEHVWGTFDLIALRVILGLSRTLGRAVEHSTSDHWVPG